MRPSCYDCARKHIAQACILMIEARLGYRHHKWLAIGHLAEAEAELLKENIGRALEIREHRKAYEQDGDYDVPIMQLIESLTDDAESLPSETLPSND